MAKVHEVEGVNGTIAGYTIFCPACRCAHMFHASLWDFNGDMEKPTFSPSMLVNGRSDCYNPTVPRCHSFVRDGKIQFLSDCSHSMANLIVDLPDF